MSQLWIALHLFYLYPQQYKLTNLFNKLRQITTHRFTVLAYQNYKKEFFKSSNIPWELLHTILAEILLWKMLFLKQYLEIERSNGQSTEVLYVHIDCYKVKKWRFMKCSMLFNIIEATPNTNYCIFILWFST